MNSLSAERYVMDLLRNEVFWKVDANNRMMFPLATVLLNDKCVNPFCLCVDK